MTLLPEETRSGSPSAMGCPERVSRVSAAGSSASLAAWRSSTLVSGAL
jgi:hypothetical protein